MPLVLCIVRAHLALNKAPTCEDDKSADELQGAVAAERARIEAGRDDGLLQELRATWHKEDIERGANPCVRLAATLAQCLVPKRAVFKTLTCAYVLGSYWPIRTPRSQYKPIKRKYS